MSKLAIVVTPKVLEERAILALKAVHRHAKELAGLVSAAEISAKNAGHQRPEFQRAIAHIISDALRPCSDHDKISRLQLEAYMSPTRAPTLAKPAVSNEEVNV